ncbi:MAG: molybdenum cofactor biosynthesis protein MoaE [Promethearchaeota archaeon]
MNKDNSIEFSSGIYNKGELDFDKIVNSIKNHPQIKEAGAIMTFTGIVRESSIVDGKLVKSMEIDSYNELANKSINKICNEIKKRDGIIEVKIIHLKGKFDISDDLVYVIVASAHRSEGFDALRSAVEKYKKEIAVWKRENYINGSSKWIH